MGLKDIEIYEGDIIIYKQTIKYICKWNKHGFGFGWYTFSTDEIGRIKTTWNYDLSDLDDTRIEVIGNIYEDKSLLKGLKDEQ